ncbi:MAG: S66 peptidase family protein [Clostridium sp.]
MKKPKGLSKGDKVAIVSLSSGILGEDFSRHILEIGTKRLKSFELEPVFMPNSLKGVDFLKNHPEARADDLKSAFKDDSIKGIICAIGGDDTYRLLPYLLNDRDFIKSVKEHPKLFTGFSDTTINHLMFYKLGLATYYGPSFICDLGEAANKMLPYTEKAFKGYFSGHEIKEIVSSDVWYEERTDFSSASVGTDRVSHKEQHGFELLQGNSNFHGRLLGGCAESLYDILSGERYADEKEICETYSIFPSKKEWENKILFIETCEEQPTPKILKKELSALKETGIFDVINGIIVGKPQNEKYYEEYKNIYLEVINNKELPILYNVNFGHALPRCVLPYGAEVQVDITKKSITLMEPLFDSYS